MHPLVQEWDADLRGGDPLGFPGYGGAPEVESVLTGLAEVPGAGRGGRYALVEGRFDVLGGSMGAVHGERVVRAYQRATDARLPVVVVSASGGARMQEGMVSLIQMARTAGAARRHAEAGLLSVAVHRSPTTGGVFSSYASLCDIRAAVEGATIGFAGPRVAEMITGERLPMISHTARGAFSAGLVDEVLPADEHEQAAWVAAALGAGSRGEAGGVIDVPPRPPDDAWAHVLAARSEAASTGVAWARLVLTDPVWLHGQPGLDAGLAHLDGERVGVLAMNRHTGRPNPDTFALAQRVALLAGRLGHPLLSFIDTRGADPGPESEARGVARAIAQTLATLDAVPVPTVALCVGEGGSGGALALAHCDQLLMLEHAIFSVIPPEGAATILHRDAARAPELAAHLKLTPADLLALGIIDAVVPAADPAVVLDALRTARAAAVIGDRHRRLDAATARWVR